MTIDRPSVVISVEDLEKRDMDNYMRGLKDGCEKVGPTRLATVYREVLNRSKKSMERDLHELVRQGLVWQNGGKGPWMCHAGKVINYKTKQK